MQLTSIQKYLHWTISRQFLADVLLVQNMLIAFIMILTRKGILTSYEYEGIYTLFFIFPGPVCWLLSLLLTNKILLLVPPIDDDWIVIVLIPGLCNIALGSLQTFLLWCFYRYTIWQLGLEE